MSDFEKRYRDPFITEDGIKQLIGFNTSGYNSISVANLLASPDVDEDRKKAISNNKPNLLFQNLIAEFSRGTDLADIRLLAVQYFKELERHSNEYHQSDDDKYSLYGNNDYQYCLWMLGIAYLFDLKESVELVVQYISPRKKDGNDPLFATLCSQLGMPNILPSGPSLLHPKGYGDLWQIVKNPDAPMAEQTKLMQSYLRNWYKKVIGKTVWQGWDQKGWIYFGFWSFEAAMVSVLYGLDDSDYREMTFYPKDLADYARRIHNNCE